MHMLQCSHYPGTVECISLRNSCIYFQQYAYKQTPTGPEINTEMLLTLQQLCFEPHILQQKHITVQITVFFLALRSCLMDHACFTLSALVLHFLCRWGWPMSHQTPCRKSFPLEPLYHICAMPGNDSHSVTLPCFHFFSNWD